jgi:hypothetical protein
VYVCRRAEIGVAEEGLDELEIAGFVVDEGCGPQKTHSKWFKVPIGLRTIRFASRF